MLSSLVAFKLCSPAPQEFFGCPRALQWEKAAEPAGFSDPKPHPDSPLPSLYQSSPLWYFKISFKESGLLLKTKLKSYSHGVDMNAKAQKEKSDLLKVGQPVTEWG